MRSPWWMHFSHEQHHWSVAGLRRRMMPPVQPHHPIWTSIAERRKAGQSITFFTFEEEVEMFLLLTSHTFFSGRSFQKTETDRFVVSDLYIFSSSVLKFSLLRYFPFSATLYFYSTTFI